MISCKTKRRRAFTLIELMIVIVIIAILAALLFPAFSSARESSRRASCISNLHQIGIAVQMYRLEEREFPTSLAVLLPASTRATSLSALDNSSGPGGNVATPATSIDSNNCGTDPATSTCPNVSATGYFKALDGLYCMDDFSDRDRPRSSYGDLSTQLRQRQSAAALPVTPIADSTELSRYLWNAWGYRADGTAYANQNEASFGNPDVRSSPTDPPYHPFLADTTRPFVAPDTDPAPGPPTPDFTTYRINVVKNSLANRFAPATTIVTYCPYHLALSSKRMKTPDKFYDTAEPQENKVGARALILRLDGSTKSIDVSGFNAAQKWQIQNF